MAKTAQKEEKNRIRLGAARFSVASAAVLAAVKFIVGMLTGSLGVLSSAVDNLADILMSGVNYLSLRKSMEPADGSHPYGHGKIETLGMVFEGGAIALTGGWIVREGVRRLRAGVFPESIDVGLVVMALSVAASWYIARRLYQAGVATDSPALKADSLHFRTDVYSGGAILLSLAAYRATGWKWLDAATGLAVGVYIVAAAARLLWEALHDLTDRGLPDETVGKVREIIGGHRPLIVDFHDLRTRRSGSDKHVDVHLVVCRNFLLQDAHRVADHIEVEVSQALGNAHVVTHIDPCDIECPGKEECSRILSDIRKLEVPAGRRR